MLLDHWQMLISDVEMCDQIHLPYPTVWVVQFALFSLEEIIEKILQYHYVWTTA